MVQAPDNPSILNKRSISETESMDVDVNISYKNIKTYSQDDQVSEEIISEDSKKMVLFLKKSMRVHQYSSRGEGSAEPSTYFKSKVDLV